MSIRNSINPMHDRGGNNTDGGGQRQLPPDTPGPQTIADTLTDKHIIALARFIRAWQAKECCDGWRTTLANCAVRDDYRRYVNADDALQLKDARSVFGTNFMCYLRTADITNREDAVTRSSLNRQRKATVAAPTHEPNSRTLKEKSARVPALATPPTPCSRTRPRARTRA
jgi:hypothetical protein